MPDYRLKKAVVMGAISSNIRRIIKGKPDELTGDPAGAPAMSAQLEDDRGGGGRFQSPSGGEASAEGASNPTCIPKMLSARRFWKTALTRRKLIKLGQALQAKRERQALEDDPGGLP